MDGSRRHPVPLSQAGGAPDHAKRAAEEFKARHPHVSILMPGQAGVLEPTATWLEVDADPAIDGTPVTVPRPTLGMLMDYLEAKFRRPA
jgi:hypothetical protein